jgi:hypothetical protein
MANLASWLGKDKAVTAAQLGSQGLYLGAKLANEEHAKQAQLWIEYDPQPPFGGIDWNGVNREARR